MRFFSLSKKKKKEFHDVTILNFRQDDPQPAPSLMTSCELYESTQHRLVVMQLRSPLIRGRKGAFMRRLVDFAKEKAFDRTLILSSTHAHERLDAQLRGDQFRYVANSSFSTKFAAHASDFASFGWTPLERRENRDDGCGDKDVNPYVPGGGFARQLFLRAEKSDVPVAILLVFCSEGDNVPEAFLLANKFNDLTKVVGGGTNGWRIPSSWSALFGNPAADNEMVFG